MSLKRYAVMAILLATPAHAAWTPQQYSAEYQACIPPCEKNTNDHANCENYCHCVMDGLQTEFPNHDQLVRDVIQQKLPNSVAAMQRIVDACNGKFFGGPAKKLQ